MLSPHQNDTILRERYRLTNIVGKGGMGNVYRAEDIRLPGRLCAIKEVQADPNATLEMQSQAQNQFLQEASILAQLDHPNLPKVSDFFRENDRDYLVMDYVPGDDLKQHLVQNGGPLPVSKVLGWGKQIVDALQYLHAQDPPVLHRDIKPANIKLTPDGRIKLVDFGLVKVMVEDDARTITVMQGRGTALYTPLEQYGGDVGHTDVRTDIYALGSTFYHLLTNVAPPDAKSRFLDPRSLKAPLELVSAIPTALSDAILWAMEMHPDERPSSVTEFAEVLFGERKRPFRHKETDVTSNLIVALWANRLPAFVAVVLFIVAFMLTIM
ncbi:MAG: serine/threonine-protein kinase [Chloroflexota bacterium]